LSALASLQSRVKSDLVLISSLEKELLFDTHRPESHGVPFPFPKLIERAESSQSTYSFVLLDKDLYVMAVAPLLAPDPIAWLCPAFRIDDDFAREIRAYTDLEITFLSESNLFGTTFRKRHADMNVPRSHALPAKEIVDLSVAGEDFLSYSLPLPAENGKPIALLQRSLDKELAPYQRLEHIYLVLALIGLAIFQSGSPLRLRSWMVWLFTVMSAGTNTAVAPAAAVLRAFQPVRRTRSPLTTKKFCRLR
jgi:adenylate cyclase